MSYWNEVKNLEGRTLQTLDRGNKFEVLVVTNHGVIVKPLSTGKERLVPKTEIDGAYRELLANREITRTMIEAKYSPRNPVYVAAILAELSNIVYSIRPIHLRVKR